MANFIPPSSLFEMLRRQQQGGMPPGLLAEWSARRNAALPEAPSGPQPGSPMGAPRLPTDPPAMPLRLPPPQGAQATLNPPDYQSLTNREIFGPGLAQGFAAASQRPVRSLAEAVGNLGSAFLAAPALALDQKQKEFYEREGQRAKTEEQNRLDERQALEDARAQQKFAAWVKDRQRLQEEQDRADSEAETAAKEAVAARARREIAAEPFRDLVDGDIGAEGALDAWVESGEEKHSTAAQEAIERIKRDGKAVAQRISGTKNVSITLPDGRYVLGQADDDDDLSVPPRATQVDGLPWELYAVTYGNGKNELIGPPKEDGTPSLRTQITKVAWEKAQAEIEEAAEAEAAEALLQTYVANGGDPLEYKKLLEADRDPRFPEEKRRRRQKLLDKFIEQTVQSEMARLQAEGEVRRRAMRDSGLGGISPPRQGEASMGSMSAQTDTMPLSGTAEKLAQLPPDQALRRLTRGSKEDYERLTARLKELGMLGIVGPDAMAIIVREYGHQPTPFGRYGGGQVEPAR